MDTGKDQPVSEQLCVLPHDIERLAQDGHYLCPGHVKALPERIVHVTELHTQLARALTETTTSGERVKSSRDATGINLNEAVFAIRKDIETEYADWLATADGKHWCSECTDYCADCEEYKPKSQPLCERCQKPGETT